MSDAIVIALIGGASSTLVASIAAIFGYINIKQGKKIHGVVEDYHKEVNGKMGQLLETTEALANATGKAEGIAEKQIEVDQLNKDAKPKK